MQRVSQAWIDNQKNNFVSEAFVEITLEVTDPAAKSDATVSDNGAEWYSDSEALNGLVSIEPTKFATCETNLWHLDGTLREMPDDHGPGTDGYIGDWLSDEDGDFSPVPVITVSFGKVYENLIPGMIITWGDAYGEWADSFRVTAWRRGVSVAQKTVEGNTDVESVIEMDISGYNKITVEILRWCLPFRRPRIKKLSIGIDNTYNKSDIFSYTHSLDVDPLSAALPKMEVQFSINNVDGKYNPDNPQGYDKYLMERQRLKVRYGFELDDGPEYIDAGIFYLSGWESPQNGIKVTFTARDVMEYMTDDYTGPVTGTLYNIVQSALKQCDLPDLEGGISKWSISETLRDIPLPEEVSLPDGTTCAEVIQYAANAGCCVMWQDRMGALHIEPLPEGETDYVIDRFVSFANAEISLAKQLKSVNVNNGQYRLRVGSAGEEQPVNNPLISDKQAPTVARWVAAYLQNRKTISGKFRADPRMDPLDRITNQSKYSENKILVTSARYTFSGAFRGTYEGREGV